MPKSNYIIEDMRLAMSGQRPENEITRAIFSNDLKKVCEGIDDICFTGKDVVEAVRFMRSQVPGNVIKRFSK